MADISFSSRAYCKIILHAAKYPHCAINGLLLAKQNNKRDNKSAQLRIEDVVPLFHICLHVSPMAEIALTMVNIYRIQFKYDMLMSYINTIYLINFTYKLKILKFSVIYI